MLLPYINMSSKVGQREQVASNLPGHRVMLKATCRSTPLRVTSHSYCAQPKAKASRPHAAHCRACNAIPRVCFVSQTWRKRDDEEVNKPHKYNQSQDGSNEAGEHSRHVQAHSWNSTRNKGHLAYNGGTARLLCVSAIRGVTSLNETQLCGPGGEEWQLRGQALGLETWGQILDLPPLSVTLSK